MTNDTPRTRPYSIDEVADKIGLCRNTVYDLVRKGELPTIRLGKRILVPAPALDRMLNGQ